MNRPGNSTGGETPPSSDNQTQRQWPGQQTLIANNESNVMNEPSLPLHDAGGRRGPSSWPQRLGIEEPRQTPIIANQESHIINQPFQPPHRAAEGRRTAPSWPRRLGIEEPLEPPLAANQESHTINDPFLPPHHDAAGGIRTPPPPTTSSSQSQLGIQEPGQPPSGVNNGSLHIKEPSPPLNSAGERTKSPFFHNQNALRVNQESLTIKKPSSRGSGRRRSVSNQSSKGSSSSSSNDRQCAICGRTSTCQWRKGPGPKSLCNACGLRLKDEERRAAAAAAAAASKLKSSNIVLPPGTPSSMARCFEREAPYGFSHLPNRVQLMDDLIASLSPNILLGHSSSTVLPQEMSSSSAAPSLASEAPYGFSHLPNRMQLMETTANPVVPENSFWGDSSGLLQSSNIVLPPTISLPAAPSFEQEAAPYGFSQIPGSVQLMNNMNPSAWENSLLGDLPSGLQSSSIVSPPEMSAPSAPYNFPQVSNRDQLMDNASPSVSENSILGDISEFLRSPSPREISPPGAPDNRETSPDNSRGA